ncbi:MAG: saccharopine dehydrogenase C-terminal domain-containing protein [Myxococcota bacterium]|nr:saccharopine dehydrogenase C-terminal domain-containing protein [Myxococcota bacterium]
MKHILVLGAGFVAGPLVKYLTAWQGCRVTIADLIVSQAEALAAGRSNACAVALDVKDNAALEQLVSQCDVTVSLLPATEHVKVAKACLKHKKHMATASYISPEMAALDTEAKALDLTFVNECGVDPGIDHMTAMRTIHTAARSGGSIISFRSYCGGLPAPEANDNPIGYKFSWAPRGVLAAATADARYLKDGEVIDVPGRELFKHPEMVRVEGVGTFEGYPNRDALPYIDMYGLAGVQTMFRGTLRHLHHCEVWYHWVQLGLLNQNQRRDLKKLTYQRFMQGFVNGAGNIAAGLALETDLQEDARTIAALEWLGMFKDKPIPITKGGNIDVMAARLLEKCPFKPEERDMIVLQHAFLIQYPDRVETVAATLVDYGIPGGDSAMARTVSLPLAIATKMIARGVITSRGIIAPIAADVYTPILDELATHNIVCKERTVSSKRAT